MHILDGYNICRPTLCDLRVNSLQISYICYYFSVKKLSLLTNIKQTFQPFIGVYKKPDTISKQKYCELIGAWANSISNHIYFCAATIDGNGDLVREKWVSILNPVSDIYEGHGELYPRCLHGPVDNRLWIRYFCYFVLKCFNGINFTCKTS